MSTAEMEVQEQEKDVTKDLTAELRNSADRAWEEYQQNRDKYFASWDRYKRCQDAYFGVLKNAVAL